MTATEAKRKALINVKEKKDSLLNEMLTHISEEADQGNFKTTFYTGGKHLTSEEYLHVKNDLGYSIHWNSPCLWYELSWI